MELLSFHQFYLSSTRHWIKNKRQPFFIFSMLFLRLVFREKSSQYCISLKYQQSTGKYAASQIWLLKMYATASNLKLTAKNRIDG